MGKGQKTKAGRILQMILLGANPNLLNPLGKRTVCSNAEDYDYTEAIEFDKLSRKGAKSLTANVPLEEMWQGKMSGPLHYNLIDDQILPFWIAKPIETPIVAGGVNCIDAEYVRPQLDRADRAYFAIEEGKPGDPADVGGYGLFTSFKWTSKRGNKGTSRFEANFVTQAAVQRALTGGTAQNAILNIAATNVSTDGVFALTKPAIAPQNVTFAVGDTTAQTVAKLAALGITATVAGTVAISSGESHTLTAASATASATIYGTIVVTLGMTAAALQTAIRALGGIYANATVTGSTTPVGVSSFTATGATDTAYNGVYTPNGATSNAAPVFANSSGRFCVYQGANVWYFTTAVNGLQDFTFSGTTSGPTGQSGQSGGPPILAYTTSGGVGTYTIAFPNAAGNVADITATPGAGWTTSVTQAGNAGGNIAITVTAPANAPVSISKISGAGWSASVTQQGGDGSIFNALLPEDPILPGHLFLYSSTTAAGLDDEANMVGQIGEWEFDDPKVCMPVSHHIPIVDPLRPGLPATYNSHAEEDTQEDGPKLSLTMDADENGVVDGMVGIIRASGARTVSSPRYWRIAAIRPGSVRRVWLDYYGSIGATAERKVGGAIEQRTFVFDLLENKEQPWNFKVKTRRPA